MKKLCLLVGAVAFSTAVMAQKPTEGAPVSLEGQISLLGGGGGTNLNFVAPALRARYFVTDNIAIRLTVGLNNKKTTENVFEFADGTGRTGKYTTKNSMTNIALGAEYHFKGTERLSPYAGLDIAFGMGGSKEDGANAFQAPLGAAFIADYTEKYTAKSSMFGVNLVAGTDFYFAQNFYIGLELGLGFNSTTWKDAVRETVTGSNAAVKTVTPETKQSTFANNFIGSFRLGWRF
jgi:outer membrane protein W